MMSFLVLFTSCNQTKEELKNGHLIVTSYYWNGRIKEQKSYIKDSVLDGSSRLFYKNGQLEELRVYKNGLPDSVSTFFYPNGKIGSIGTFENGELIGEHFRYYKSGKMETYGYSNKLGAEYSCNYDTSGRITFERGSIITLIIVNSQTDTFKSDGLYKELVQFASPPGIQVNKITLRIESANTLPYEIELPISNRQAYYSRKFNAPGEYQLSHTVYYTRNRSQHFSKVLSGKIFLK